MADILLVALFLSLAVNVLAVKGWWSQRRARIAAERKLGVRLGQIAVRVTE